MTSQSIAPTKSGLLALRHQLAIAEEGYDLLEQKRQLLVLELVNRLRHAQSIETQARTALESASASLREAVLATGSLAVDQAAAGVFSGRHIHLGIRYLMGLPLPSVRLEEGGHRAGYGVTGTSADTDLAGHRFHELIPLLAELAELQTVVLRLSTELRRTQRRCNALSKVFIPNTRKAIWADSKGPPVSAAIRGIRSVRT